MAVDEAGYHQAAAGILGRPGGKLAGQIALGTDPADRFALPRHRGTRDHPDVGLPGAWCAGRECSDVPKDWHLDSDLKHRGTEGTVARPAIGVLSVSVFLSVQHGQVDAALAGGVDGESVAGIGVAHDAGARIGGEDALEPARPGRRCRRPR